MPAPGRSVRDERKEASALESEAQRERERSRALRARNLSLQAEKQVIARSLFKQDLTSEDILPICLNCNNLAFANCLSTLRRYLLGLRISNISLHGTRDLACETAPALRMIHFATRCRYGAHCTSDRGARFSRQRSLRLSGLSLDVTGELASLICKT